MDIKYLVYITTMASEKNMTKAAEKLYVSQSSLSHYLNKLENEIGASLFLRGKNELVLTPAGELYVQTAQQIIDMRNKLYQTISNMNNQGHLRISTSSQWGLRMLADIMPRFKKAFPSMTFELSHHDVDVQYQMLADGKLDFSLVAIGSKDQIPESGELLQTEEMFFALPCNHPYCQKHPEDSIPEETIINGFCTDTFLISRKPTANRFLLDQLFDKYGKSPEFLSEVNGIPVTRDLVSQGIGMSLIPLSGKMENIGIHFYHIEPPIYRYNVFLRRRNLKLNQPEQFFYNYVMSYFQRNVS